MAGPERRKKDVVITIPASLKLNKKQIAMLKRTYKATLVEILREREPDYQINIIEIPIDC